MTDILNVLEPLSLYIKLIVKNDKVKVWNYYVQTSEKSVTKRFWLMTLAENKLCTFPFIFILKRFRVYQVILTKFITWAF